MFGDGSAYGVSIDYHHERLPLGTAGALAGIEELDEPFLMMNGDVITTLDFGELLDTHVSSGNALTIATQVRTATIDFGVLRLGERYGNVQQVVGYLEKPHSDYVVSMGVYVVSPHLLQLIEPDAYLDFPDLVLQALGRLGAASAPTTTTGSGSTSAATRTTSARSRRIRTFRASCARPRARTARPARARACAPRATRRPRYPRARRAGAASPPSGGSARRVARRASPESASRRRAARSGPPKLHRVRGGRVEPGRHVTAAR